TLAGTVGAHQAPAGLRTRRHVHDHATAPRPHPPYRVDAAVRGTDQVHLDDAPERLRVLLVGLCEPHDAGVVQEAVDATVFGLAPADEIRGALPGRDIGPMSHRDPARPPDRVDDLLQHVDIDVVHHEPCTRRRGIPGAGRADASPGTGHHNGLA